MIRSCIRFSSLLIFIFLSAIHINATEGDNNIHDPSTIIVENGTYHLFGTGKQIKHLVSTDLELWTRVQPVFERGTWPSWINEKVPGFEGHFWAPDIIRMNNFYYLYYSCSTFGSSRSAIGVIRTPSLDVPQWEDLGVVVSSFGDTINAIDAGLCRDETTDEVYMTYGSFFGGIGIIKLDTITGKPASDIAKVYGGNHEDVEASTMYQRNGYYYLVVNRGKCCSGLKSTYRMIVSRSTSPFGPFDQWKPLLSTVGRYIGPGHFGLFEVNGKSYVSFHFYDGDNSGSPTLEIRELKFDSEGWPIVDEMTD